MTDPRNTAWASDVPISMPQPIEGSEMRVDMEGFTFTTDGLRHNITQADIENAYRPTYSPPDPLA